MILRFLLGLALLATASCGGEPTETVLRFSGIPDQDKARLTANGERVATYLSRALGRKVVFVESSDYKAACAGIASNKLDLVWLGGVTAVQAERRSDGKARLVACRAGDLRFKSYFIANADAVAAGRIGPLKSLEDGRAALARCTFTFGSKDSTSGRVMPQYFLERAGISMKYGFARAPRFALEGGHTTTLRNVASGLVDVGAINYQVWDAASDADKKRAPVIYTTPEYVDYCLVAHERLGAATIERIQAAFTTLDRSNAEHRAVLDAFRAESFLAADPRQWDEIRAVLDTIKLD